MIMRRGVKKKVATKQSTFMKTMGQAHTKEGMNLEQLVQNINERAFRLWEKEGKPHGRDFDIWLKAEQEIFSRFFKK